MSELELICRQLCETIDVIIDEKSGVNERNAGNQYIETFKSNENVLLLLNVSLKLLNETFVDSNKCIVYKHFGLQLLENVIRFHWNSIDGNLKQQIKQLIESWFDTTFNTNQIRDNYWRHLMNGSSRCVVEVLMREWPQNWPQFMPILLRNESTLSLYCIWQLAEDIGISFKPNNGQRRREMTNEFNRNLNDIYGYISKCVTTSDLDLISTSISTLNVLFEWTQLDTNLLQILMQMLCRDCTQNDHKYIQIKQSICDCYLICLNRKQLKPNDKTSIQIFFNDFNISLIVTTVRKYVEINAKDSEEQSLAKRLVSLLSEIGQQMVILYESSSISSNAWNQCLEVMFFLFSHSNVVFNAISVQFWYLFIKNYKQISNNNSFDNSLHLNLITLIPHKISKQVFDKSILGFEFDDIEDFDSFFFKFRADTIELLRQLTILDQKLCFDFVSESLNKALLQSNKDRTDWEILAQLSAAVFNKVNDKTVFQVQSNCLLQSLIEKSNKDDPDVISSQLSCISALTVFLPHISSELINQIIKWTLFLAAFTTGEQNKWTRSNEVKNLRRHSCSLFIKICQTFPSLLVPLFVDLKAHIHSMCSNIQQFSQMEKCALNEGLVLISNEFPEINDQKQFVEELIGSISWINSYKISGQQFFYEIGLGQDSLEDDEFGHKRANLLYVVNLMLSLLKRIKTERQGVFVPSMFAMIRALFPLVSNLNTIWRPEYREKCNESFKSLVYSEINESDKINILDLPSHSANEHLSNKSDAYRMQNFIWTLHENCYMALGLSIAALKPLIYEEIADFQALLIDIEFLPEWKLRMIIKNFIKPLIANCPQSMSHYQKIGPIVTTLIPFVFNKVNDKWTAIKNRSQVLNEGMNEETEPIESELISDQINRLLSKEFIELMVSILNPSKNNDSMEYSNQTNESNEICISEFGNYLLNGFPNVIIYPTAKALSWLDTNISLKTCQLNSVLIRKIINDNMIQNEGAVYFLFEQLLTALSFFGEHEQNQSILLHLMLILYEGIAIKLGFDSIKLKLSHITGTDIKDWSDFDQKLIKNSQTKDKILFTDKRKKEFLKKLVSQVIGKNIGQLYKYNSVEIKNLKPIFYSKNRIPNITNEEDLSLCLLFNDS